MKMEFDKTILITGGAGFIGSHAVRHFVNTYKTYRIVNFDALTYAGNLEHLKDIEASRNYVFVKGDLTDTVAIDNLFSTFYFDGVIHMAAESHVDRSISDPICFLRTNILGTGILLNACYQQWKDNMKNKRFVHISTDEVFGSIDGENMCKEEARYNPQSPYSASKAGADHLVRSYGNTYGFPFIITLCSNNFGPNQYPEKLIPLCIMNIFNEKPIPIYGDGKCKRDWLFVDDHVQAIDRIFHNGRLQQTYNISAHNEWENINLVKLLCCLVDEKLHRPKGSSSQLIEFVQDRPGHDRRYAIDSTKLRTELDWLPSVDFERALRHTIDWYHNKHVT